jgi:acyl carrier protein
MTLRDRAVTVFVAALELDTQTDVGQLKYQQIPQWDSIGHMSLVAALEDEFEVEFDIEQTLDLDSFETGLRLLQELGAR